MRPRGFTLIETVLATVVISVGLIGIFAMIRNSLGSSVTSLQSLQAAWLARERLDRILYEKEMQGYGFAVAANYPGPETFAGNFSPFVRATEILEVDDDDLTSPRADSGYKRVTVTVTWPPGNSVAVEGLVTDWGLP